MASAGAVAARCSGKWQPNVLTDAPSTIRVRICAFAHACARPDPIARMRQPARSTAQHGGALPGHRLQSSVRVHRGAAVGLDRPGDSQCSMPRGCWGTDNHRKGTDDHRKGTDNHRKGTDNHRKGTDNHRKVRMTTV